MLAEETVAAKDYSRTYLTTALALYGRAKLKCGAFHPWITEGVEIYRAANDRVGARRNIRGHGGIAVAKHNTAAQFLGIELAAHSDGFLINGVSAASEDRGHVIGIVGGWLRQGEGIADTIAIALALHTVNMQ